MQSHLSFSILHHASQNIPPLFFFHGQRTVLPEARYVRGLLRPAGWETATRGLRSLPMNASLELFEWKM